MPHAGRPDFASDFPRGPALDAIVDAFARGDYAHVRIEAARLGTSAETQDVRAAARCLLERTRPDPLAVVLLTLTGGLLVLLATYWVAHGRSPPSSTRSPSGAASVERAR